MCRRTFAFRLIGILLALVLSAPLVFPAWSQSYAFQVDRLYVDVYWNAGGTAALDYTIQFTNLPGGAPIDYIDLGLPNRHFDAEQITATVNGQPVDWISRDDYEGNGSGVALALGANAIRPGQTAVVRARVPGLRRVLYVDSTDENYASAVFSPTWFGADFVTGETDIQVTFHLPPGVQPQEPRWHAAPEGWPSQPATGIDQQGRVTYTWRNSGTRADREYPFGASFPGLYVPAEAIAQPGFWQRLGIDPEAVIVIGSAFAVIGGLTAIFASIFVVANRRQMQYLPPKISVEGHGIKRGLTAVEAAILLQQPLDKVLTLILFGALKKEALQITQKDPVEIKAHKPLVQGLKPYEIGFIAAFEIQDKTKRRAELQNVVVDLVKAVERKMKGFSRKETIAYYEDIVRRAWSQIEAAGTPEVQSERFEQALEWTMLDKQYGQRTRETFAGRPVIAPVWWTRYDPGYSGGSSGSAAQPVSSGGASGAPGGLPHLPGADFAASLVSGSQNMAAGLVGSVSDFTSGVTNQTNPPPAGSGGSGSSSGGGCACACAGCACACAGGGR